MRPVLTAVLLLLFVGCVKTERSGPLTEDGVVVQTILRPFHQHQYVVPVTHTDANDNTYVTFEKRTDTYSEQHWIVFACQHGEFAVDREDVWRKVSPGMRVKIKYRELTFYTEKKGQKIIHGTDLEFEDANPASAEWSISDVKVK